MLPEPSASKQRSTPSSSAGESGQPKRLGHGNCFLPRKLRSCRFQRENTLIWPFAKKNTGKFSEPDEGKIRRPCLALAKAGRRPGPPWVWSLEPLLQCPKPFQAFNLLFLSGLSGLADRFCTTASLQPCVPWPLVKAFHKACQCTASAPISGAALLRALSYGSETAAWPPQNRLPCAWGFADCSFWSAATASETAAWPRKGMHPPLSPKLCFAAASELILPVPRLPPGPPKSSAGFPAPQALADPSLAGLCSELFLTVPRLPLHPPQNLCRLPCAWGELEALLRSPQLPLGFPAVSLQPQSLF